MSARATLALAAAALLAGVAACAPPAPDSKQRFDHWLASGHAAAVADYAGYLQTEGVGGVVPMGELLRSGRHWQRCGAPEFTLPPRGDWPAIVPTLRLAAKLRDAGLLPGARVASAWRDPRVQRLRAWQPPESAPGQRGAGLRPARRR